jgi:MYXO-CTERM domain-containing protein
MFWGYAMRRAATLGIVGCLVACTEQRDPGPHLARGEQALSGAPDISAPFTVSPLTPTSSEGPTKWAQGDDTDLLLYDVDFYGGPSTFIVGMRVTKAGTSLDPNGLFLGLAPAGSSSAPIATFTGDGWVVVYPSGPNYQLSALHVGKDGTVGPATIVPVTGQATGIAWDGTHALLATSNIGVFLDRDGQPSGSSFTLFTPPDGISNVGGIGTDGSVFVTVYATLTPFARIYAASITSAGATGQTATIQGATPARFAVAGTAVELGPTSFVAFYAAPPPSCALGGTCLPQTNYCRPLTVTADGSISLGTERTDGCGVPVTPMPQNPLPLPSPVYEPMATFASGHYLGAWHDGIRDSLFGTRIAPGGALLDGTPFQIGGFGLTASSAQSSLFARLDNIQTAALVDAAGSVTPVTLSGLPQLIGTAAIASDGDHFLVGAAPASNSDPPDLSSHSLRLSASGALEATGDFPLAETGLALAFDGTNYVAAWSHVGASDSELRATRITPDLQALDDPPKTLLHYPLSSPPLGPSLAAGDGGVLITWVERPDTSSTLRAALLSPDLELSEGPITVATTAEYPQFIPAWDGARYWLAWMDDSPTGIYVRRAAADLTFLDPERVFVSDALAAGISFSLGAGANQTVFVDYRSTEFANPIRGRFLTTPAGSAGSGGTAGSSSGSGGTAGSSNGSGGTAGTTSGGGGTTSNNGGTAGTSATNGGSAGTSNSGGGSGTAGTTGGTGTEAGSGGEQAGGESGSAGARTEPGTGGTSGTSGPVGGAGGRSSTGGTGVGEAGMPNVGGSSGGTTSTAGNGGSQGESAGRASGASGSHGAGKAGAASGHPSGGTPSAGGANGTGGAPLPGMAHGCGCTVPARTPSAQGAWLLAVLAYGASRRRQRSHARQRCF